MLAQRHATDKRISDSGDPIKHAAAHIDFDVAEDVDDMGVRLITINFLKNRHGPLGKTSALFNARTMTFVAHNEDA
jgi:hypothetical protein